MKRLIQTVALKGRTFKRKQTLYGQNKGSRPAGVKSAPNGVERR